MVKEQYLDFAHELGDRFAVMERGRVVLSGPKQDVTKEALGASMAL
jgi:urea transport system ATP-binding protein